MGEIRSFGRKVTPARPQPLDRYSDNTGAALCLVPRADGLYEATAVVAADGATYLRWTQNVADQLVFPT